MVVVRRRTGIPTTQAVQVSLTDTGRGRADQFYAVAHERVAAVLGPLATRRLDTFTQPLGEVVTRDDVSIILPDSNSGQ